MNRNFILLAAGLLVLSAMAIFNPNSFLFDERLFPPNVELMEKHGFGERFLVEMVDQAPGPLYQFVHLPLKGITKLDPQALRIVNLILFYMVIVMLTFIYHKALNQNLYESLYSSLHIMAVTTIWQIAGLVLTEMPAMFFLTLSFFIGTIILKYATDDRPQKILLYSVIMGVTGGLAILGRTPYLVMIPAFFCILIFQRYIQQKNLSVPSAFLPYAVIALAMIIPIFIIWGGLAPPLQPRVDGAIKPWHALLAFAYTGVTGLIINYKWFLFNRTILYVLIGTFIGVLILNLLGAGFEYAPMSNTVVKVFGTNPIFIFLYIKLMSSILASAGAYFLICCYYRGKENMDNPVYLFALVAALAILASSAKISHQFSSRYVAQAAPFLVIIFTNIKQPDKWKWVRLLVGMVMGILSLNTYAKVF